MTPGIVPAAGMGSPMRYKSIPRSTEDRVSPSATSSKVAGRDHDVGSGLHPSDHLGDELGRVRVVRVQRHEHVVFGRLVDDAVDPGSERGAQPAVLGMLDYRQLDSGFACRSLGALDGRVRGLVVNEDDASALAGAALAVASVVALVAFFATS